MTETAVQALETLLANAGVSQFLVRSGPLEDAQAVAIVLADMPAIHADAYVVPHFQEAVLFERDVAEAVARGGGEQGLLAYYYYIEGLRRPQERGEVHVTPSGGGNSTHLINVMSLGDPDLDSELRTVAIATGSALQVAGEKGFDTVIFPALGTGVNGQLTAGQSARAILGPLYTYWTEDQRPHRVIIAIYGDRAAFNSFSDVLNSGVLTPEAARVDAGKTRRFDSRKWAGDVTAGMLTEDWLRGSLDPRKREK